MFFSKYTVVIEDSDKLNFQNDPENAQRKQYLILTELLSHWK